MEVDEWRLELSLIQEWFDSIGPKLPVALSDEWERLSAALG